jgi:hypothetical protein
MLSRRTWVLFLLALASIAAFVLVELPGRRARDRAERESARLLAFDPATIDRVRVRRGKDELVFAVRDTHWEMLAPAADLAEASTVTTLIQALHEARVERTLEADENEDFGLRPPAAAVWLVAGRDTVAHLELGGYTIDRTFVYARRARTDIVLAPTDILRACSHPADHYRNRRVAVLDRSVVRAFNLRTPGGTSRWVRSGGGWYTIAAGDTVEGDSMAVEGILRTLRGLRVERFLAEADTAGAVDPADVVIRVENRPPAPVLTVRFRCPPGGACRARCDHETRVSEVTGIDALLSARLETLRDRRLLQFDPQRAGRIEFSTPDTSAVLVRAGTAWAFPNPAMGAPDRERVGDFVRALRALRWTRLAGPRTAPSATDADVILVVYARDGTVIDELRGSLQGEPPVFVGTSRSSGLTTETDASALEELVAALRRVDS